MAEKKSKSRQNPKETLILLCIAAAAVIGFLEGNGYDPIGWIKKKLLGEAYYCEDDMQVHFIDVGQGDCTYVTAGGVSMLIDCGEASEYPAVENYLDGLGVKRIDYVVATHPHSDHMGGMSEIIGNYDVGEVIFPSVHDSDIPSSKYFERFLDACDEKGLEITLAEVGSIINIGDARAEIIAPISENYSGANDYSIGIILSHGSNDFLLTGDAEKLAEDEMLESGRLREVEVYKVGHHGSDTSSSADFVEAISPDYAVFMCGEGNSYGHPHDKIVKRLEKYVRQIYRTDLNGSIVFESDGINMQIRAEREN